MIEFQFADDLEIPAALKRNQEGKSVNDLPFHPLANLFPLIEGTEFDELVASIKENGLREPIVICEGAILDGRNRYRACRAAGVSPMTHSFTGRDPVRFVIDKNINRRHLSESQRALIGARLATAKSGQRTDLAQKEARSELTNAEAASAVNVSHGAISAAKRIIKEGTAEEIAAVRDGKASVTGLAKEIAARKSPAPPDKREDVRVVPLRGKAAISNRVREALIAMSGLPPPAEVVGFLRGTDAAVIIDDHLVPAAHWLGEFATLWSATHVEAAE